MRYWRGETKLVEAVGRPNVAAFRKPVAYPSESLGLVASAVIVVLPASCV